jgi:hypothetical protein
MQLHGRVDIVMEERRKKKEFLQQESSFSQRNLFESDSLEGAMKDPLQDQDTKKQALDARVAQAQMSLSIQVEMLHP